MNTMFERIMGITGPLTATQCADLASFCESLSVHGQACACLDCLDRRHREAQAFARRYPVGRREMQWGDL